MNEKPPKTIHVSAAIIFRDSQNGGKEVFATERGYGDWKGWWEFPGGKIEAGETAWLDAQTLGSVKWLPADEMILGKVKELLFRSHKKINK